MNEWSYMDDTMRYRLVKKPNKAPYVEVVEIEIGQKVVIENKVRLSKDDLIVLLNEFD